MTEASTLRLDAAAAVRRLVHTLVARDADEATLQEVATVAGRLADDLGAAPPLGQPYGDLSAWLAAQDFGADGAELRCVPNCLVAGPANPMSVGLRSHREGDEVVARVVLDAAFEGLNGRSHGGVVASIFDEVMGFVLWMEAVPAYTARLTVNYRSAMPVFDEVEFRGRVASREGRKLFLEANARSVSDGALIAEADALFVAIPAAGG